MTRVEYVLVGQSQAEGIGAANNADSIDRRVSFSRGSASWIEGVTPWVLKHRNKLLNLNNISVGSSGVSPLITSSTPEHNWSPAGTGDNLWKSRVLGETAAETFAYPLQDYPPEYIEVNFGNQDDSSDSANFEANMLAFCNGLFALFPTVKIMVGFAIGPADVNTLSTTNGYYQDFINNNVDNVSLFEGPDFFTRMINKGTVAAVGPLLNFGGVPTHMTNEGYRWAAYEWIRAAERSGWLG